MTKDEFLKVLSHGASSSAAKIGYLQFFIDNYHVLANSSSPGNPFGAVGKTWTQIQGVKITGGSQGQVNYAFMQLQSRLTELKNFK